MIKVHKIHYERGFVNVEDEGIVVMLDNDHQINKLKYIPVREQQLKVKKKEMW